MPSPLENKLRHFADCDDLFDNVSSDKILEWVNAHADVIEDRKAYQKKYQTRKRELSRLAQQMLEPDELARIDQIVAKKLEEDHRG